MILYYHCAMLTIVIQAGGRSSRMGQDKALMPFLGKPLITRPIERLRQMADEILVTTNRPEDYTFLGLPLFGDILPDAGALGGLYTALSVANQPFVAVIACDMPFVKAELLRAEFDLLQRESADVVVPRSLEGTEPFHAVYRRSTCLSAVQGALDRGERKMISWYPEVKVRIMEPAEISPIDPEFRSFLNLNRPDEFRRAEELAGQTD